MRKLLLPLLCCCAAAPSWAQPAYPDKPIRIVVGYPPGGSSDFSARLLGNRLAAPLGQSIVIDNRGGAAGNIANEIVVKSAPDGYTLLVTAEASITINASVYVTHRARGDRDVGQGRQDHGRAGRIAAAPPP